MGGSTKQGRLRLQGRKLFARGPGDGLNLIHGSLKVAPDLESDTANTKQWGRQFRRQRLPDLGDALPRLLQTLRHLRHLFIEVGGFGCQENVEPTEYVLAHSPPFGCELAPKT